MKKIYLFCALFVAILINVQAQDYGFEFSTTTETYQDLSNSTSLNDGTPWQNPSYTIPMGFDFEFYGEIHSTIYFPSFAQGGTSLSFQNDYTGNPFSLILPMDNLAIDLGYPNESLSPLSYKLTGENGSHILKIEWNTIGFAGDDSQTDYINFQVWFYESSNQIEFHYGPSSVEHPNDSFDGRIGFQAYIINNFDIPAGSSDQKAYFLSGNPADPTVTELMPGEVIPDASDNDNVLNYPIESGRVYTFTPSELSTKTFDQSSVEIYPNPASDHLALRTTKTNISYIIYNELGQQVKSSRLSDDEKIDISNLQNGLYFIKLKSNQATVTKKFIKLK